MTIVNHEFEEAIGEVVLALCRLIESGHKINFRPGERRLGVPPRYEIVRKESGAVVETCYSAAEVLRFAEGLA